MFDRVKYKTFAKKQLKGRWTVPVLVTLFCYVIIGLLTIPDSINSIIEDFSALTAMNDNVYSSTIVFESVFSPITVLIFRLLSILSIFITLVLTISQIYLYLKMSRGPQPVKFSDFIDGFSLWGKGILGGLWMSLWTFLWVLLFIIPGFVKAYAYSQTMFLLAEYPELSVTKAMKVSIEITKGRKGSLFIMDLSFFGWAILAGLSFGIGYLWLIPYMTMSKTNAYHGMLQDAVNEGRIKEEDLKD